MLSSMARSEGVSQLRLLLVLFWVGGLALDLQQHRLINSKLRFFFFMFSRFFLTDPQQKKESKDIFVACTRNT